MGSVPYADRLSRQAVNSAESAAMCRPLSHLIGRNDFSMRLVEALTEAGALLTQMVGQLGQEAADACDRERWYAAAPLTRQIVEVHYLSAVFRDDAPQRARWLPRAFIAHALTHRLSPTPASQSETWWQTCDRNCLSSSSVTSSPCRRCTGRRAREGCRVASCHHARTARHDQRAARTQGRSQGTARK